MSEDAIKVASNNYKVLFENDRVRLLEYRAGPGDKTEMHSHPDVLAYAITPAKFRFTLDNGQNFESELKAGEPMWAGAMSHATENLGSDAHVLLVELK